MRHSLIKKEVLEELNKGNTIIRFVNLNICQLVECPTDKIDLINLSSFNSLTLSRKIELKEKRSGVELWGLTEKERDG